MGRIQSSVGLISGISFTDTIEQLIAVAARPRDLLSARTSELQESQVAVTQLTASVIGVQFAAQRLGSSDLFQQRTVNVSNPSVLSATTTGTPTVGTYSFTPVRQATSHQLLSGGIDSNTTALGAGTLTLRTGGFVDRALELNQLNAGAGVDRGQIRITDRSGSKAVIDLSSALNIDDVLDTINSETGINVTASVAGDRLRLVDNTGQTTSNLIVQDVGADTTATDLGLASINVAATSADGNDIFTLHSGTLLSTLNDGNGVSLQQGVADLQVSFQDGSADLNIEFRQQTKGETTSSGTTQSANGADAQITFTSVSTGADFDGYAISFVDEELTAGNETVTVDTVAKTIRIGIDSGSTRAFHVVNAFNNDATASQLFSAAADSNGNGSGFVDVTDTGTTSGGAEAYNNETTIGDLLDTINAADPARLLARISAAGDQIELVDLTAGANTFAVTSLFGGTTAEDLGLVNASAGGVLTSDRVHSGLRSVLLDSLSGGNGLGTLGSVSITDRNGSAASVDLRSAETLGDVIEAINNAGVGVTADVNSARNGLVIQDTSGGAGNLIVANEGATTTADALNITYNGTANEVDSGSLDLQIFSLQHALADLRSGEGIDLGSILFTDSAGQASAINLSQSNASTVGDVVNLINGLSIGVTARVNDTGDGLVLIDTAGGPGNLTVSDVGNGTAAADLQLAGVSSQINVGGSLSEAIDGSYAVQITVDSDDTLQDLVTKINESSAGIQASVLNTGASVNPFHLSLVSTTTGRAGEILVDATALGIDFDEVVAAQDAVVALGTSGGTGGILATSSSNRFESLVAGLAIDVNQASDDRVVVDITQTESAIADQLQLFVDQFNSLRDQVDQLSFFNPTDNTTGVLFGSTEVLRIELGLSDLVGRRLFGAGNIESLEELGVSLNDQGKLSLDRAKFSDKYASDAAGIEQFLTQEESGFAARFDEAAEQIAGIDSSLLVNRAEALQRTIDTNNSRIADLNESLEKRRVLLLNQFIQMESIIGQLQNNLGAISAIQPLAPLVARSNS